MKIRITPSDGSPWEVELAGGTTSIGRDEDCSITLSERTVSRRHAELYEDETGTLMIRDAGSRYGTRLNGRSVEEPSPFYHGDILDIGGFVVEIPGSTVDAGPSTGEMETRRLKKDTKGGHPAVVMSELEDGPRDRRLVSWFWVVLLVAGLILLGFLVADYLSGGETPDGDAALRPPAPAAAAASPMETVEDPSWPSSVHSS